VPGDHALIAAFVKRSKRDRYREILANPRLHHKFTSQLAHFTDFDPKYRLPIPSDKLFADNIARELKKRHSPSVVFAISEDPALDQKELLLDVALGRMVGRRGEPCREGNLSGCSPSATVFMERKSEQTSPATLSTKMHGN
jgi:hypothetical protein